MTVVVVVVVVVGAAVAAVSVWRGGVKRSFVADSGPYFPARKAFSCPDVGCADSL